MILETYLKVRTINMNDLLMRFNGLLERRSKEELERVGALSGLWRKDTSSCENYEGKRKMPLAYPIAICSDVFDGMAYFMYKDDLAEFLFMIVAVTGNPDYEEYLTVFELLDDGYRVSMNERESEYFKGDLGDRIVKDCDRIEVMGQEVYMREKEVFFVAGVL